MGEREAQKSRFCLSSLVLLKLIEPLGGGGIGGVPAAFRLFFLVPKS